VAHNRVFKLNEFELRPMKTVDSLFDIFEAVKQRIHLRGLQRGLQFRVKTGKADIAIAFHCFFKAAQKQVNCRSVQFPHSRAIEYHRWAVNDDAAFKVFEDILMLCSGDALRQLPDRD